ncbi:hypothetical protein [Nonomuraea sp. NPDC049400]|uniref:hypothetical protein n=1 Tax=Nonomuraea sp. NPDC049400 TaxID=3364352 RepID=UPI003792BAE4
MRKGQRLAWFMASAMLALGIVVGGSGMSTASADVIRPYLYWSEDRGHCGGEWTNYLGTRTYDPNTHSVRRLKRTESGSTGRTQIYNQNGVRQAKVYDKCISGRIVRQFIPTVYRHRSIKVSYVCYAGRCRITSTLYGSWLSGTADPR